MAVVRRIARRLQRTAPFSDSRGGRSCLDVVVQIVVYKKVSKMPNTMQISKCQTGQTCDHSVNFTQHSMNPFTIQ